MAVNIDNLRLTKTLGAHTRVNVPFSWSIGGVLVDLEAENYTVRVYVTGVDDVTAGPFSTTVAGTQAHYLLQVTDLEDVSQTTSDPVTLVAVAENGNSTLISDGREIIVGDWGGSTDYEPLA